MTKKKPAIERRISPSVGVELDIDGKPVTLNLSFTLNALARIEERTGLKLVGNIFTLWSEMTSAKVFGTTFWSAVVENHPEYDSIDGYNALASHLDGENVDRAGKALAEAYPLFLSKSQAELFRRTVSKATGDESEQAQENPTNGRPE